MNLLFVTEKFPFPLDTGGNVRTYHLLRGLATGHAVTLVATDPGDVQPGHVEHLREFCRQVVLVRTRPWTALQDAQVLIRSMFSGEPVVVSRRFRRELATGLTGLFKDNAGGSCGAAGYDAVYFNHLDAAIYLPQVPRGLVTILDEHNVVTNQVRSMAAAEEGLLRRYVLRRDTGRVARHEARIANQMDLCLACSDVDAAALRSLGVTSPVAVIPNGVDTTYFTPPEPRGGQLADTPAVVFVGTLDYDPCERGVWHFSTAILPLIRRSCPGLRFVVVGRNPSNRLKDIAAHDKDLVLTGRVEDVRPWMAGAQVCVVPLLSGSGTRLKILEAMAAGLPVVSTTIGAEGIEARSGQHLWIADDPAQFAEKVVRLLHDPDEAGRLGVAARALVSARYSWEAVHARLLGEMRALETQVRQVKNRTDDR